MKSRPDRLSDGLYSIYRDGGRIQTLPGKIRVQRLTDRQKKWVADFKRQIADMLSDTSIEDRMDKLVADGFPVESDHERYFLWLRWADDFHAEGDNGMAWYMQEKVRREE